MDYSQVIKELTEVFNDEEQAADYSWLVFLYNLNLVNNVLYHLHYKKDVAVKIPGRYKTAYWDIVNYYNRYYGGKDEKEA